MALRKRETTEVRQQQITEAALHVIGQKGISGATTAEIAAATGISEGNLYRHFRSKEEIIKAIIDKISADLSSILADAAGIDNRLKRLEYVFKRHLSYIEENVGIPRTVFSEEAIVSNENLRIKIGSTISNYFQGVKKIVEQGQINGIVDAKMNAQAITSMFIGTIHFLVTRWMTSNFSQALADEADDLWKNFEKAITTKESTMARKAWVDQDECISCGLCVANLPDVFRFDDSGKAECFDSTAASEDEIQTNAIDICPVSCIRWQE